jgi:hypothetical protein
MKEHKTYLWSVIVGIRQIASISVSNQARVIRFLKEQAKIFSTIQVSKDLFYSRSNDT